MNFNPVVIPPFPVILKTPMVVALVFLHQNRENIVVGTDGEGGDDPALITILLSDRASEFQSAHRLLFQEPL